MKNVNDQEAPQNIHPANRPDESGKLLQIVEKLQEQCEERATRSAILITLNELNTFAQRHFEQEEKYLESVRSVEYKARKNQYQKLLSQLAGYTEDFKSSASGVISSRFYDFLQIWLNVQVQHSERDLDIWDSK